MNKNQQTNAGAVPPLALDAEDVIGPLLPSLSVRTWRRMDSAGRIPRGVRIGGRKLWRVADVKLWIELGGPDRAGYEAMAAEVSQP